MSRYIGALRRIGVFTRQETHLMIYEDALVVARSTDAAAVLGAAIGLGLGNLVAERINRRGQASTPQEIAAEAPQNRVTPLAAVEQAKLRKIAKGLYRELELQLDGGIEEVIRWQRGDNPDDLSLPLLEEAFGSKLMVEWDVGTLGPDDDPEPGTPTAAAQEQAVSG